MLTWIKRLWLRFRLRRVFTRALGRKPVRLRRREVAFMGRLSDALAALMCQPAPERLGMLLAVSEEVGLARGERVRPSTIAWARVLLERHLGDVVRELRLAAEYEASVEASRVMSAAGVLN